MIGPSPSAESVDARLEELRALYRLARVLQRSDLRPAGIEAALARASRACLEDPGSEGRFLEALWRWPEHASHLVVERWQREGTPGDADGLFEAAVRCVTRPREHGVARVAALLSPGSAAGERRL